jgi:redox-sensitive bicupin YhaK (pirin superfamily)
MSVRPTYEPICEQPKGAIALLIEARARSLGEFDVRRVLPVAKRRMVGPFIFFDHMGPASFAPGQGIAVRPHPHIGIATITYLFEGRIMHRDSLGFVQPIDPGAVNLMTAGRGIVHSERAPDPTAPSRLHGIQSWTALPLDLEETAPAFVHYPAAALPQIAGDGFTARVIMGRALGAESPVQTASPTLYLEAVVRRGARFALPGEPQPEQALYVVEGAVDVDGTHIGEGTMAVLRAGVPLAATATADSRVMILGGAPVGERHIWWNFVSSSKARIEQAKGDWRDGRFGKVPGDDEFIPLPET